MKPEKMSSIVLRRAGHKCAYCGADRYLHRDHIVPRRDGGTDHDDNIQVLCDQCGSGKGDGVPLDMAGGVLIWHTGRIRQQYGLALKKAGLGKLSRTNMTRRWAGEPELVRGNQQERAARLTKREDKGG